MGGRANFYINNCGDLRSLQPIAKGFGNLEEPGVKRAYAIFNNCYENFGIMNATTMAAILRQTGSNSAS
jgi:hypothetical protein